MGDNELMHYGVKGMKWGVRKAKRSASKDGSAAKMKKKGLSDKQKRAIKIGAVAAASVLVAYGGYKLAKSGKLQQAVKAGKTCIKSMRLEKRPVKSIKAHTDHISYGKRRGMELSNDELTAFLRRDALENKYDRRMKELNPNKGKEAVNSFLKTMGAAAAGTGTALTLYGNLDRMNKVIDKETEKLKKKKQ